MFTRLLGLVALLVPVLGAGCQTVGSQAPLELKEAQKSIDTAKRADVEDYMPSAMEAANRKLARSVDMLDESSNYKDEGVDSQAEGTRNEAIKLANEAKAIADGAVKLVNDMRSYNDNSGAYLSSSERGAHAAELEAQLAQVKTQFAELDGKYKALTAENQNLANRPPQEVIPKDFSVAKPVAYFTSGSTTLPARYRSDLKDLAGFVRGKKELTVTLEGFADPRGSAARNKALAEKRLQVVADELKAQGVAEEQLKLVPVGATADSSAARGASGGELQLDRKVTATVSKTVH